MNGFEVKESGPGYLSLAIVELKDNHGLAREIQERFAPIRGIDQLEIDPVAGWLTVFFNYRQLTSLFSLLALKEAFSAVFPEVKIGELASLLSANLKGE
jgi:uncharacterized membrane protein